MCQQRLEYSFVRWIAINRVIDIDVISITDTQYDPARRGFTRTELQCFTSSIIFYTRSEIFADSRLNEHDFGSFCAPIISRFERRFWTLTLKKKSENDEIRSARRNVSCCWSRRTSLRFAVICTRKWNWAKDVEIEIRSKVWTKNEKLLKYCIKYFSEVILEDYQIYSFEATRMTIKLIVRINVTYRNWELSLLLEAYCLFVVNDVVNNLEWYEIRCNNWC